MNVFYLDEDVRRAARYHVDKHVVKMPLECAQMLSTAVILNGGTSKYRISHKNHPSSKWVRDTRANFLWLFGLAICLCEEHRYRYYKKEYHKSRDVIIECYNQVELIPEGDFYEPPQCMPDEYKMPNAVDGYRKYYMNDKKHIAAWRDRPTPYWWQETK